MVSLQTRRRDRLFTEDEFHYLAWSAGNPDGHPDRRIVSTATLASRAGTSGRTVRNYLDRLANREGAKRISHGRWLVVVPSVLKQNLEALTECYRLDWPPTGLKRLVGGSKEMEMIRRLIRLVASARVSREELVTVLITGETGVGKGLVARLIHEESIRKDGEFFGISCANVPVSILESELFGYERGAFTGAVQKRHGWFELADRGTIFLDEIGEVRPAFQRKVLQVLEDRQFVRLGGTEILKTGARVLAATNRDLKKLMERGRFRRDLFYRLNVFPIHLPPLRERPGDIGSLIAYFTVEREKELEETFYFSSGALDKLLGHGWPGNVRELRNVLHRAFVLAERNFVEEVHILFE